MTKKNTYINLRFDFIIYIDNKIKTRTIFYKFIATLKSNIFWRLKRKFRFSKQKESKNAQTTLISFFFLQINADFVNFCLVLLNNEWYSLYFKRQRFFSKGFHDLMLKYFEICMISLILQQNYFQLNKILDEKIKKSREL